MSSSVALEEDPTIRMVGFLVADSDGNQQRRCAVDLNRRTRSLVFSNVDGVSLPRPGYGRRRTEVWDVRGDIVMDTRGRHD